MADPIKPLSVEDAYHSLPERAEHLVLNTKGSSSTQNLEGIMSSIGEEPCGTQSTILDLFPGKLFCLRCID